MKSKRLIAMLLAFLLVVVLFAGCGQTEEQPSTSDLLNPGTMEETPTPQEEPKEVTTYTAFFNYALTSMIDPWETPIGKKITELTGVKLKTEYLVGTDARQKAGVMIASGDYPDIIIPGESTGDYVAAGAFVPLDDYLENQENIKQAYPLSELQLLKMQYGTTYYISGTRAGEDTLYPSAGFYLVADAVEKAGWPVSTLDEYAEYLKTMFGRIPNTMANPPSPLPYQVKVGGCPLQYGAARFWPDTPMMDLLA